MVSQVHQGKPMHCTQIQMTVIIIIHLTTTSYSFSAHGEPGACRASLCRAILCRAVLRRAHIGHLHTHSESRKQEVFIFGYTGLPETYRRAAQCHQHACAHAPAYKPLCDWPCRTTQKNEPKQKKEHCAFQHWLQKAEVCWASLYSTNVENHSQKQAAY